MKSVILFSLGLSFMLSSCSKGHGDIIIVPEKFKGYILIIYNQKDGVPIKYEGKKRVFKIPQSGILKTQFKINDGWREFTEYYYVKISPENKLSSFAEFKKIPVDTIVGFEGASGGANKDLAGKDIIRYSLFYVGAKEQIEKYIEEAKKLNILKLGE